MWPPTAEMAQERYMAASQRNVGPVEGALLSGLFLLATITALVAVWALYWEGRKS
jgi:hypothetical protein